MKQVNFRIPLRVLTLLMGLMISISAFAQITVNGNVKDATGEPVIGASVRVVGTTIGTTTDFDGNFTLSNVKQGAKLQVSYVGSQTQEVAAAPNVQVVLQDNSQVLNEVVVIGYGVAKKKDLTGSVAALKPDTKNKGVVVSAQDMLAGKIAGVAVTSEGGTPGGSATIRIRGGSSLNASNDPLIVVDGVPLDHNGIKGFPNGLGMINPQDIESFNVLKDASACAIYGSRGSNGVIIITTKKGKRGQKPSISYNGSVTMSAKKKTIDVMTGDEYRDYIKKAFAGNEREADALAALGNANTDWQDEIYRTAWSQDHNVQLSGSVGKILPYRVSLGYTDNQGILKTSDFKRYTVGVNLNPSLFDDHLVINLNANWMWGRNHYADGAAINNAVRFDPTQPVMAEGFENFGGYFEWLSSNSDMKDANWPTITNTNAPRNPVAILMLKNDRARSHNFTGSADFDYKVHGFEDLRLHLTIG
ncbi:MAG: SusC/RagA family TonB-linked outer membrane protein, partial [Sodaliphilus sp.]|nr:SusC/RagA family TonB-linked outer membrane protein [Sodaliphilus sp.]